MYWFIIIRTRDKWLWLGIFGISVEDYDCRLLRPTYGTHDVVGPMYVQCEAFLRSYDSSILALMDAARAVCELAGH